METIEYNVLQIRGEYAIMISSSGVENTVAMALLPIEISEGDRVIYENLSYRIL